MTTRRRFPNWVPDAIVESYVELADWLDAKGAGSAEDADMSDIRQQLSDGIECLEAVMIAPTMRGAWISLGERSDHRHYRRLARRLYSNYLPLLVNCNTDRVVAGQVTNLRKLLVEIGIGIEMPIR